MSRYNVVAIGPRDYFQVAIALHEVGRLGRLIADFYTPDILRWKVAKRWSPLLPSRKTISFLPSALLNKILKPGVSNSARKRWVDDLFGFVAGMITFLGPNRAVVYSYYLYGFSAFYRLINRRPDDLICFQVHPSPWFINSLMRDDQALFEKIKPVVFQEDLEGAFSQKDMDDYVRSLRLCRKVICASEVTARSVREGQSIDLPFDIVPYGSKLDRPPRAAVAPWRSPGSIKLVTVCQLTQRKGMHWAFEAMSRLPPEERSKFEWLIVSNSWDPAIKEMAPDNVTFLSRLSDERLSTLLASADLFLMPSILEGFGLVYAECLALGTPVVYTRNTGADDICRDGVHGYRVDYSSVESVEALLRRLSTDPDGPRRMRDASAALGRTLTWELFRERIRETVL